jgi:isopentenyldiphosphate isomerase
MEKFDVLDCTGNKTGGLISRDDAHASGAWHGAFHCLIIYRRNGKGCALFQKRSRLKKIAPGRIDVSAGGHYSAGEDARAAGPREIREELGLDVAFEELQSVGRRVFVYGFTPGVREYEFQDVFLLEKDVARQSLTLQKEEVDGALEVEVDAGVRLLSGEVPAIDCVLFTSGRPPDTITLSKEEFVPCLDNYYLKLLLLAQRYFQGERNCLII